MKKTLKELASLVGGSIIGYEDTVITGAASIDGAKIGDIIFIENEKYFDKAIESSASAIVAPNNMATDKKPLILADHPKLAFAKIIATIAAVSRKPEGIHPAALIAENALIGEDITIGPYAMIMEGAKIGDRVSIGAGCSIGRDVEIGNDCVLHPRVTIYDRAKIRNRVIIHSGSVIGSDGFGYVRHEGKYHKFPQIGDVIIEDDVEIGANSCVDRGALDSTIIGRGTKIDNLVQIAHNVRIGVDCVIAAQVGISGSSIIEDNVVIGGQVGIADHVKIQKGAIAGAQAGIPTGKIIRKGIMVWGTPARPIDEFKEIYAHTQQLPALKRRIAELEKKLETIVSDAAKVSEEPDDGA